jgi:hypothetical protein
MYARAVVAALLAAGRAVSAADGSGAITLRHLDTLSVAETRALLDEWGLGPYFGRAFVAHGVDGEMLQEFTPEDVFGADADRAFPDALPMHRRKLLRKIEQLAAADGGTARLVDASLAIPTPAARRSSSSSSNDNDGGLLVEMRGAPASGDAALFESASAAYQQPPRRSLLADDGACDRADPDEFTGVHVKNACAAVSLGSAHDVRLHRNDTGVGVLHADSVLLLDAPRVLIGDGSGPGQVLNDLSDLLAGLNATAVRALQEELAEVESSVNNALGRVEGDAEALAGEVEELKAGVALVFKELYRLARVLANHSDLLGDLHWAVDPCASAPCRNGATCSTDGAAAIGDYECLCPDR